MKRTITIILFFICVNIFAQQSTLYNDSINNFSIKIPQGWNINNVLLKKYSSIKLNAFRTIVNKDDTTKLNFNINIFDSQQANLDSNFAYFLSSSSESLDYKLHSKGTEIINNLVFKWVIQEHSNYLDRKSKIINYVFITSVNSRMYIITLVSDAKSFNKWKYELHNIAISFRLADL